MRARRRRHRGAVLAGLRHRLLGLIVMVFQPGCAAVPLAGGLGLCSTQDPDIQVTLLAPTEGAILDGAAFDVTFELSENPDGAGVDVFMNSLELANLRVPAGQRVMTASLLPRDPYGAPLPSGTYTLEVFHGVSDGQQDRATVQWIAPWRVASCRALARSCLRFAAHRARGAGVRGGAPTLLAIAMPARDLHHDGRNPLKDGSTRASRTRQIPARQARRSSPFTATRWRPCATPPARCANWSTRS